ncbi:MAG: acyltransferase family protein [Chroococcidiopsidaceae cyanobacterium CP_BM_ER_R8_30]|nr:acyltransferase family protein [Chroococcidiopsidaceae cyanobacterium CP_BM_ER_R8_30]
MSSRFDDGKVFGSRFDGWSLDDRDPQVIQALLPLGEWLYRYYFRVTTDGWQHLPSQGSMLIVGTHNGGMIAPDTLMFMYDWFRRFGTERLAYGLMHPYVWMVPVYSQLAVKLGAIRAHPKMAIAALQRGAAVLVYPGGAEDLWRPHHQRHKIHFAGRKGFIKLALTQGVPIVPAISNGAHDTLLILTDCYKQLRQLHEWGIPWLFGIDPIVFPIYLGLPWGLAIGPWPNIPLPIAIHTRICEPILFERYGHAAAKDRDYVDACYEKVCTQMQLELDRLVQGLSGIESLLEGR